jgi:hypothetical protein
MEELGKIRLDGGVRKDEAVRRDRKERLNGGVKG